MGQAEKQLLERMAHSAESLHQIQRGLHIGQIIALIRSQLKMSQRALAKRAEIPQSTISKIESNRQQPSLSVLRKLLDALECELLVSAIPRCNLFDIRRKQAQKKAKQRLEYLLGTMNLEQQKPDQDLIDNMIEEEVNKLLNSSGRELWEDDL